MLTGRSYGLPATAHHFQHIRIYRISIGQLDLIRVIDVIANRKIHKQAQVPLFISELLIKTPGKIRSWVSYDLFVAVIKGYCSITIKIPEFNRTGLYWSDDRRIGYDTGFECIYPIIVIEI